MEDRREAEKRNDGCELVQEEESGDVRDGGVSQRMRVALEGTREFGFDLCDARDGLLRW